MTCELTKGAMKYSLSKPSAVAIGLAAAPRGVKINGAPAKAFKYDKAAKTLTVSLPAGEGVLTY